MSVKRSPAEPVAGPGSEKRTEIPKKVLCFTIGGNALYHGGPFRKYGYKWSTNWYGCITIISTLYYTF